MAEVGGLLGLFLGCSLLSIMELVYFLTRAICKLRPSNKLNINTSANYAKKIQIIQEMKYIHYVKREEFHRFSIDMKRSLNELSENMKKISNNAVIVYDEHTMKQ